MGLFDHSYRWWLALTHVMASWVSSCPFCVSSSLMAVRLVEGWSVGIGASSLGSPWNRMSLRLNSIFFSIMELVNRGMKFSLNSFGVVTSKMICSTADGLAVELDGCGVTTYERSISLLNRSLLRLSSCVWHFCFGDLTSINMFSDTDISL